MQLWFATFWWRLPIDDWRLTIADWNFPILNGGGLLGCQSHLCDSPLFPLPSHPHFNSTNVTVFRLKAISFGSLWREPSRVLKWTNQQATSLQMDKTMQATCSFVMRSSLFSPHSPLLKIIQFAAEQGWTGLNQMRPTNFIDGNDRNRSQYRQSPIFSIIINRSK